MSGSGSIADGQAVLFGFSAIFANTMTGGSCTDGGVVNYVTGCPDQSNWLLYIGIVLAIFVPMFFYVIISIAGGIAVHRYCEREKSVMTHPMTDFGNTAKKNKRNNL